jgi:hypothetical protein
MHTFGRIDLLQSFQDRCLASLIWPYQDCFEFLHVKQASVVNTAVLCYPRL